MTLLRRAIALAALMTLAPVGPGIADGLTAAEGPPPGVSAPHPSIHIQSDEDFEGPTALTGVRGGNGTPSNPYVISNWTILADDHRFDIRLVDTDSHVVLEDLLLGTAVVPNGGIPSCRARGPDRGIEDATDDSLDEILADPRVVADDCAAPIHGALSLANASNVTIRNVTIERRTLGIGLEDADNVTIEDTTIGGRAWERVPRMIWAGPVGVRNVVMRVGLGALGVENVDLSNVTLQGAMDPARIEHATDVSIVDSTVRGLPDEATVSILRSTTIRNRIRIEDVEDLRLEKNEVHRAPLNLEEPIRRFELTNNRFLGGDRPAVDASGDQHDGYKVCGNEFRDYPISSGDPTLRLRPKAANVVGNAFVNTTEGASVFGHRLNVSHNAFRQASEQGLAAGGELWNNERKPLGPDHRVEIHNNSFEDTGPEGRYPGQLFMQSDLHDGEPLDARWNWWGPEGPNVSAFVGPGESEVERESPGEKLWIDGNVTYEPWLEEPPATGPTAVDCEDVPIPEMSPIEESFHRTVTKTFEGPVAAVVEFDDLDPKDNGFDFDYRFRASFVTEGPEADQGIAGRAYDPETGEESYPTRAGFGRISAGGEVDATLTDDSIEVAPVGDLGLRMGMGWWCQYSICPHGIAVVVGANDDIVSTTFRLSLYQQANVSWSFYNDTGFFTAKEMDRRGGSVWVRGQTVGAAQTPEAWRNVTIEDRLVGYSHYVSSSPGYDEAHYDLHRSGEQSPARDRFFEAAPSGTYRFHLQDHESAGRFPGTPMAVWADLPVPAPPE